MPAFETRPVSFSSPIHSFSKSTDSQHAQLIPRLAGESLDFLPFTESFTALLDDEIATSLLFPDPPETQRKTDMVADLSYDVQIKDLADLAPRFRDGEIEEVMVISPKPRPACSFRQDVTASDFRLLQKLFKDSISSTYLCRKCDNLKLYVMRISNKERLRILNPRDYIQYQMKICQEIREWCSPFLAPFIWVYEDGFEIRSIAQFYPQGSLQDLLDRDTNLSENHALQLASEMVEALHTLHYAGIIHRDLTPCNVVFDASGHVVITGFGQACRPHLAASFLLPETGPYCAPELILGWAHDFSADCWSFGVLVYMMLFGCHPYVAGNDNDNAAIMQTKIIHCSLSIPHAKSVSWAAQDLLVKCLERNAALRLNIGQIRKHVYFGTVNWKNVTSRKAPLVYSDQEPVNSTRHSEVTDNDAVSEEDEPVALAEEKLVDSFTPVPQRTVNLKSGSLNSQQDTILRTQRRVSSQSTRLEIVREVSDEEEGLEGRVESSSQDHTQRLRRPPAAMDPERTPGGPLSLWDALDLEINSASSHYSKTSTASHEEPRKSFQMIRKSRSVTFQDRALSTTSITSSVPSGKMRSRKKLRKKMRPASTPTLRSPHLDPLIKELPLGVKQIGYGIGFSPMEPLPSHSRSVYRSAIRACQKLVPVIRRKISRQTLYRHEQQTSTSIHSSKSQQPMVVMREIYGPTWALGATDNLSATTNESEGPVTPETPFFDQAVTIMQHESTLRLVPSSGLQPAV